MQLTLDRNGNATNYAEFRTVSVARTIAISTPFNNVSLLWPYNSGPSEAFWRVVIVLNQSESSLIQPTPYNILPKGQNVSGQYTGVVSIAFVASGKFTLWIIVYGVYKSSMEYLRSFSEIAQIYEGPLAPILFSVSATLVSLMRRAVICV
jgi:hypothetical protein